MSKLLGATTVFVLVALGVAIASLVLNILILNQVNSNSNSNDNTVSTTPNPNPDDGNCVPDDQVSKLQSYADAANRLIACINPAVDPCEDFYQFTCGKYIQDTNLDGQTRKGTYDEAQYNINLQLASAIEGYTGTDTYAVYQQNFYKACVTDGQNDGSDPSVYNEKLQIMKGDMDRLLGFPLFGSPSVPTSTADIFKTMGLMELQYTGGPFLTSIVTSDYGNNASNALYVSQPSLAYPRDYYVLPQYIDELQDYSEDIQDALTAYYKANSLSVSYPSMCDGLNDADCIQKIAEWAVDLERLVAMSSWSDDEQRNYKQQYNPFTSFIDLDNHFKTISLSSYIRALLSMDDAADLSTTVVLSQPTYFAALDNLFTPGKLSNDDFVNYLSLQFLLESIGTFGVEVPSRFDAVEKSKKKLASRKSGEKKRKHYSMRRGRGARRLAHRPVNARAFTDSDDDIIRTGCVDLLIDLMPYAPGYTYYDLRKGESQTIRGDVQTQTKNIIDQFSTQINSLDWMDDDSKARAHAKSANLVQNLVWPDWFDKEEPATMNDYHKNYVGLADKWDGTAADYWEKLKAIEKGMEQTELFDLLSQEADRTNFLMSPAIVNAWYQPERNSITFPFGILNPPYYQYDYPQSYNYAGQGGTGGHELTHGYDDEGTQFDEFGMLSDCKFTQCSILDSSSITGFTNMAQCVVQQYNTGCCPLKTGNVRCANGAATQGENIADIGGQMAAYGAFVKNLSLTQDVEQKKRLPGLEQYTPEQIFWITYGVSWCMKLTDDRLATQLLTDPHAPSSCRVNQVMQDEPHFGMDFKCKVGSPMYPEPADSCQVWYSNN